MVSAATKFPTVALNERAEIIMGQSPPGSTYNGVGTGTPFLQGKAEFGSVFPSHTKWTSKPLRLAPKGSTLVSVRAPVGDANLADREYCIGRGLAALVAGPALDPGFLFFWTLHSRSALESEGTGSTFKAIRKSVLTELAIPDVPLPEQRAIAHVLRAVQRAKEATEQVIAAARELKKSLMRHLFTYGNLEVRDIATIRLATTEAGEIRNDWGVRELGDLANVTGGKRLPKGHAFAEGVTPYPYIRVTDFDSGSVSLQGLRYLRPEDRATLKRYTVTSEDLCVSIAGTTGIVARVPDELDGANLTENAAKITLITDEVDVEYLRRALSSPRGKRQMETKTTRSTQPKLALARLRTVVLPIPSRTEQRQIAANLKAVDQKIAAEKARRDALATLFDSLLHDLMTARLRVTNLEMPA